MRHDRRLEPNPRHLNRTARAAPAVLSVIAVALATCVAGILNQFTQDDVALIQDSARLHGLAHWREILSSPYWPPPYPPDLYRPVASLLLAIQYALGSGAPIVFRLASCALYAAASVAVFTLASRLCSPAVALAVALLFAVHPVHVEAVTLAVGQSEIILALFTAVAVMRYLDLRRRNSGHVPRRDWAVLAAVYVAAALTKEQGLLLPAFLLAAEFFLIDESPLQARVRRLWKGYAALALVAVVVILTRVAVLGGNPMGADTAEALVGLTLAGRAVTMLQIVPEWLRLLAWPLHLRADYSPAEFLGSRAFGSREALGLLLLAGAIAVGWFARRRAPVVSFGLVWSAIALFPVSNVIFPTGILIAERTLFLPSIGFLLAVGGAADYLLEGERLPLNWRRVGLGAGVGALMLAGIARSVLRQRVWHDPQTLSLASVNDAPRSWRVQHAYGDALFDLGRTDEAIAAYQRAIELAREPWWLRNRLARHLRLIGRDTAALEQLSLSVAQFPEQTELIPDLVAALLAVGKYEEARRVANRVILMTDAPPIMGWLRHVADSAIAMQAPAGTIRIGVRYR